MEQECLQEVASRRTLQKSESTGSQRVRWHLPHERELEKTRRHAQGLFDPLGHCARKLRARMRGRVDCRMDGKPRGVDRRVRCRALACEEEE